ncbi:hypothetical protein DVS28_a4351 [Euzebya pacifica]|uniref:Uncharacterized protein n=1 Tax=Euzebya pacifica TaxID=1608957 RepID=A0A346Y3H0_9ACTN|nr:hypothetical protein DVS28_a4351 [Euzebya pacifica]
MRARVRVSANGHHVLQYRSRSGSMPDAHAGGFDGCSAP